MENQAIRLIRRCQETKSTVLDIGNCGLTDDDFIVGSEIDIELRKCTHVKLLFLSNIWRENILGQVAVSGNKGKRNKLNKFPDAVFELIQLRTLICAGDKDTRWGIEDMEFVARFPSLEYLDISYNRIKRISGVSKLSYLQLLYLTNNEIDDIRDLTGHISLSQIYLQWNLVQSLNGIEDLNRLSTLDISSNYIRNIKPLAKYFMKFDFTVDNIRLNAKTICLYNNPLLTPSFEIIQQGGEAIINFFAELERLGTEYLYEAKMLIVGQPRAGKTSLRYKLFNVDSPLPDEDKTTRGIDIQRIAIDILDIDGKPNKLYYNVWDFGGQQIYQTTHQFFLTQRSLYVLVIDTGRDNFTNEDSTINYWLQTVELLGGNSPLLILKNEKNDRPINIDINQKKQDLNLLRMTMR